MRFGKMACNWRSVVGVLTVGALAFGLRLEGAPVSSESHGSAVMSDNASGGTAAVGAATNRIKIGKIPASLPVNPVVTVDPYADLPSRLRAAGLLQGPMPLGGMNAVVAAGACSFDIDC